MYFYMIKNFAYGEINERSFSNPHPWFADFYSTQIVMIDSLFIESGLHILPA